MLSTSPGIIFLAAMLKRHRSISPQGRIVFAKNLFSIYQTARITDNHRRRRPISAASEPLARIVPDNPIAFSPSMEVSGGVIECS
jgi:hypothetical protein